MKREPIPAVACCLLVLGAYCQPSTSEDTGKSLDIFCGTLIDGESDLPNRNVRIRMAEGRFV
ncbi:MAG: hypothetical protein ACO4B5_12420, partial [Steroidobacteraceae bacterium]